MILKQLGNLRKNSKTFGKHFKIILSEKNSKSIYVPKGFAHGFITLEDDTIFTYKCTGVYNAASEGSLLWNDADLNIDWRIDLPLVSDKDLGAGSFNNFESKPYVKAEIFNCNKDKMLVIFC